MDEEGGGACGWIWRGHEDRSGTGIGEGRLGCRPGLVLEEGDRIDPGEREAVGLG